MLKKRKKELIAVLVLIVVCIGAILLYQRFRPSAVQGEKEVKVAVVHGDGSQKKFSFQTDAEYLGEVLLEQKLIEGEKGTYGLFIKAVDGEAADDSKQQWWCITKEGERVNTSADATPIQDGEQYELTLKEGY